MLLNHILKLGDARLYETSKHVVRDDIDSLAPQVELLHNLIIECQQVNGFGRGIAAPQIGVMKRVVCLNLNGVQHCLLNPELSNLSESLFEIWDDCMSFPNLLVRVNRHKSCTLKFRDLNWNSHEWNLQDDLSELLQHECDHLDGVLATQRAIDNRSLRLKP